MQPIRAFIAVHLPTEVKTYLNELNGNYAGLVPAGAVRWVKSAQMHLTLRFLGDTMEAHLPVIGAELDRVGGANAPFTLQLDKLGCFPNERRPRVVWVGVAGDLASARKLKQAIDMALTPFGWQPEERLFQAHLTLGRVKHSDQPIKLPWDLKVEPLAIPVREIHLVQSELRPSGPVYTSRQTVALVGPAN